MTKRSARIVVAFGTRPEATKMAPIVRALRDADGLEPSVLVTGQHREQLDSVLETFGIDVDADLAVMTQRQSLAGLLGRIVPAAGEALTSLAPDLCLVHGDTTSTLGVALAAFYGGIPVGHVEAGLRSFDLDQPFPEEGNRRLVDAIARLALAPTDQARANLRAEGVSDERIVVTGNTAVDAVRWAAQRPPDQEDARLAEHDGPLVTITLHRRENLPVLASLAGVVVALARRFPDHLFVWPVHLNPAVHDAVVPVASGVANVLLVPPMEYARMASVLQRSRLIVTDSGGLQEEGAALGVPVAVVRNVTERPEGVAAGVLTMVGNDPRRVERSVGRLLADDSALAAMRTGVDPYGDGRAAQRTVEAVAWSLGMGPRPDDWRPRLPSKP